MLSKAMLVLSVINIPLFLFFKQYQTVTDAYGGLNVGSLGQAEAACLNVKIDNQGVSMACTEGYISNITEYGVFADDSQFDYNNGCSSSSGFDTGLDCLSLSEPSSDLYI
jgi:hypothetical protein